MIYILEGADGTGKTTLANAIQELTKGHLLHCSYNHDWDIQTYHNNILNVTVKLSMYQDVIIDRWAPSEHVYGRVFRGGPSYDTIGFIEDLHMYKAFEGAKWIYCTNENAVENHIKNSKKREEIFSSMEKVVEEFDNYVSATEELSLVNWIRYNFNKVELNEFVREITKGE